MEYGAIADDVTDNSEVFLKAWKEACEWKGRARVLIPLGKNIHGQMAFVIRGILKAPTDPSKFLRTDKWINFRNIDNLTVSGGGTLDGQGKVAWPYNDCKKNDHCPALPAIGSSQRIGISRSIIGTGDDCISILPGTREVNISDVVCGPGHGMSVGSLGKSGDEDVLSGITVKNCTFRGTSDGVRIKTWAYPMLKDTEASNFVYEDILMDNVGNPIIIDQQYCPVPPCKFVQRHVQKHLGSSGSKVAVTLRCSQTRPCNNVVLEDINLSYVRGNANATALCSHVNGHALANKTLHLAYSTRPPPPAGACMHGLSRASF
ncbi:hypothetical protein I3760_12G045100 [Carya illinoinensis]|nr:hypothetical protein I3760_12G045100 [Carya illinoinensis]